VSRLLLVLSLAGFAIAIWSFFEAPLRGTKFDLLRKDINASADAHHFEPEERENLLLRVGEVQGLHAGEIHDYSTAYLICFLGILGLSASMLVAHFVTKAKRV
jgi:hypothetical protein